MTLIIRELVQRRGVRVFFYKDGTEVTYGSVLDGAMTSTRGMGAQMEVENTRAPAAPPRLPNRGLFYLCSRPRG